MTDIETGKYLAELMGLLESTDYSAELGAGDKILPVGAKVWPVQGKSLSTLWTKKGINLKRPVVVALATKLPSFMAKKMSYFYGKPEYAMLWFKEPIPLGSSQMTYGMVYQVNQAWDRDSFVSIIPSWSH
jgi:hypothetical protein